MSLFENLRPWTLFGMAIGAIVVVSALILWINALYERIKNARWEALDNLGRPAPLEDLHRIFPVQVSHPRWEKLPNGMVVIHRFVQDKGNLPPEMIGLKVGDAFLAAYDYPHDIRFFRVAFLYHERPRINGSTPYVCAERDGVYYLKKYIPPKNETQGQKN